MLITYTNSNIKGYNGLIIQIDDGFKGWLDLMNQVAVKYNLIVWVIDAMRYKGAPVPGAVVNPANHSNHYVGSAVDVNIQDINTNTWWNHIKLETPSGNVLSFINDLKGLGMRWGGDWPEPDTDAVHFDSNLNHKDPQAWLEKFEEYQPSA